MKQRTIHRNDSGMQIRMDRFEKYLLQGAPKSNGGSEIERIEAISAAVLCNLERAAKAPFPVRVKVAVLKDLYFSSQPAKTLLAMKAISEMASDGSKTAKKALLKMADKWLKDQSMRYSSKYLWEKGLVFILNSAELLGKGWLNARLREAGEEDPSIVCPLAFWLKAIKKGCCVKEADS